MQSCLYKADGTGLRGKAGGRRAGLEALFKGPIRQTVVLSANGLTDLCISLSLALR